MQDNLAYTYTTNTNQLNSVADAAGVATNANDIGTQALGNYVYDAIGQLTQNISENLYYFYNTQGLVTEVKKGPNTVVKFFYNERGQRIKKESYNTALPYMLQNTTFYALDLSGNTMAVYLKNVASTTVAQIELPIYGLSRLGRENRLFGSESYEITDHLGNVRAVIASNNGEPSILSYADYYPFGEQLPERNSMSGYRYNFQGQELDPELGMEAFQLRLWDGRIGRWLSPDPYGQYASPYLGMGNNPTNSIDFDGWYSWFGAALRWVAGGFEGHLYKSPSMGDWAIATKITGDGAAANGSVLQEVTIGWKNDFGSKRIDFKNRDWNFGGAGAGGMSLFGSNADISKIKLFEYVGNHKGVDEYESVLAFNGAFTPGPVVVYPIGGSKLKYYNVHEPGHVLQYRMLGFKSYWLKVAIPSLVFAATHNPKEASHFHTETQANRMWWMHSRESDTIHNPFK